MVKDIIVNCRINETILVLISLKRYFSHPENQYLAKVFLNFKEALYFRAQVKKYIVQHIDIYNILHSEHI